MSCRLEHGKTHGSAIVLVVCIAAALVPEASPCAETSGSADAWRTARYRGAIYADCGRNASRLLDGRIELKRDPKTHLYSRGGTWDYHNEAADHYSSLVLVACYVRPELNEEGGTLHQTLLSSQKLCATPSGLPTTYDLKVHAPGNQIHNIQANVPPENILAMFDAAYEFGAY